MEQEPDARLEVILRWAEAWNRKDWNGVADSFSELATNHSMMDAPVVGREQIRARTRHVMERCQLIDISFIRLSVLGNGVAAAERIDACQRSDGSWGRVPVAGFYEICGGLIVAKRDYYDRSQLLDAMGLASGELPTTAKA